MSSTEASELETAKHNDGQQIALEGQSEGQSEGQEVAAKAMDDAAAGQDEKEHGQNETPEGVKDSKGQKDAPPASERQGKSAADDQSENETVEEAKTGQNEPRKNQEQTIEGQNKPEKEGRNEPSSAQSEADLRREGVRGVIFQFCSDRVLFEFKEGEEEAIGVVTVDAIAFANCNVAPGGKNIHDLLAVGDEIECDVRRKEDLPKFFYTEEEEGEEKTVEIEPKWLAEKAVVHSSIAVKAQDDVGQEAGKKSYAASVSSDAVEDVVELEVQPEDMLDYEEETGNGAEEIKTAPIVAARPEELFINTHDTTPPPGTEEMDVDDAGKEGGGIDEVAIKARLSYLKKPMKGREPCKATAGVMEIVSGEHAGKLAHFQNGQISIWGRGLDKANLLYNLRHGDEFDAAVVATSTCLNIKWAKLGGDCRNKLDDPEMLKWLRSRELDFVSFRKWYDDEMPKKVFFPLVSEIFEGKVEKILSLDAR